VAPYKAPDYIQVERLLFRGFLEATVKVGEVPFVFKTLNQTEFDLVLMQGGTLSEDWRTHSAYYLAYSTLCFNRVVMLAYRQEAIPYLADIYLELPESVMISLLMTVTRINNEAREALEWVQPYAFGDKSREHWQVKRRHMLCAKQLTGIEGTDSIGLNYHQKLWSFLNGLEDKQQGYLDQYTLAKFIVSPHAPKDVQKMDRRDQKKLKELQVYRQKLHKGKAASLEGVRQIKVGAETAEELMQQMEQNLSGGKDYHDLIIEEHKRKIRANYLAREAARQAKMRETQIQRQHEINSGAASMPIKGFTAAEVEHLAAKAAESRAEARAETHWVDPHALQEQERNLLRWGYLRPEDLPEERQAWYEAGSYTTEVVPPSPTDNPLMQEHYEWTNEDRDDE
jgi:hypothetical protein